MKGTRLPEDWEPNETLIAFSKDLGIDPIWEADKFKDFWLSKSRDATKIDWNRAFKNWIRIAAERRPDFGYRREKAKVSDFKPKCLVLPRVSELDRDEWRRVAEIIAKAIGVPTYNSWIDDLTLEFVNEIGVGYIAKSRFIRDHVLREYEIAFRNAWGRNFYIRFEDLEMAGDQP